MLHRVAPCQKPLYVTLVQDVHVLEWCAFVCHSVSASWAILPEVNVAVLVFLNKLYFFLCQGVPCIHKRRLYTDVQTVPRFDLLVCPEPKWLRMSHHDVIDVPDE